MRITDIDIQGFGMFHDTHIPDIAPAVTVFEGRNEAGKTTLMAYIRAVLFGFEHRRGSSNRYEPVRGGAHGGALVVETAEGKWFRIERLAKNVKSQVNVVAMFPFQQTVSEPEKTMSDEARLQQLVYGTSKLMYQNVFAFGIGELERLDTLQADEISQHIYTVGMGAGLTALPTVQNSLEAEQAQLFKSGGRKPPMNQVLQELDHVQTSLREMQKLPDEYQGLKERSRILDREIEAHQGQFDEAHTQRDWVASLVNARGDWEQLQVVRQALHEIPIIENFPAGGVERLEQVERTLGSLEARLDALRSAIHTVEERNTQIPLDAPVLEHQHDREALEHGGGSSKEWWDALSDWRSRVADRRNVLDETVSRLGPAWNDERLEAFALSVPMRENVHELRDRLEACQQEVREAHRAQQDVERLKKDKEEELERLQEQVDEPSPFDSESRIPIEEREMALRQWVQLQHELDLTRQRGRDLQALALTVSDQIDACQDEFESEERHQPLPLWALFVISVGFLVLSMGSMFLEREFFLTSTLATVGIVVIGLLSWWRYGLQRHQRLRLEGLHEKCQELMDRQEEVEREVRQREHDTHRLQENMKQLSQGVLGQDLDSIDLVDSARRSLEAERRAMERREALRVSMQDQEEALRTLREKAKETLKQRQSAEQAQNEAQAAWNGLLVSLSLSSELTPDGALEVMADIGRAQGQLREWRAAIAEKRAEVETTEAEKRRSMEQRKGLLQAGGAVDAESFRQRADLYARRVVLEYDQRQLEAALRAHAGTPERYQAMAEALSMKSRAEWKRELSERERDGQHVGEVLTKKLQEKGRVEQRIHDLEHDERLSNLLLKKQDLVTRLGQYAERWAVLSICRYLLDKARELYERERQPAVLQEASQLFSVMTAGEYVRVQVPLGEMRLEVQTAKGASRPTEKLSRGTAEQLYLAMRIAFVREYAKHAGPLPVVVDDILVNFDPKRAKATIKVLGQLAATHQVLVFTCHPHVARWFEETLDDVSVRPMPQCVQASK